MAWTNVEGWQEHGRVWVAANGRKTFYIRRSRAGKRFNVNTGASTLRGALAELARWESNPESYRPAGSDERVLLTEGMVERYVLWCGIKGDPRWLRAKELHLRQFWLPALRGRDLRNLPLSVLHDALLGAPDRAKRIVVIKHLYAFLRQTGALRASEDPTVGALPVPQAAPAQDTETKVIPEADYRAVLALLPEHLADAARLQAGTGAHVSEVVRFARSGSIEGCVLAFQHKGGHVHRVQVSEAVAEVAGRVRARKPINRNVYYRAVAAACERVTEERRKVDPKAPACSWTPGWFRATFATRAVEAGESPAAVALALGHRSNATTLKFYATTAVAPKVSGGIE